MVAPGVYVVGAGRVGTAMARLLAPGENPRLIGLWSLTEEEAQAATELVGVPCAHGPFPADIARAEWVVISVTDPAVASVAGALLDAGLLRTGSCRVVLHCGGFRPAAEALKCLVGHLPVGTLHPLLSVASPEQAARMLPQAHMGLEGDPEAVEAGRSIARALGASTFNLPQGEGMGLYHAAAVMASNHAVALWDGSRRLMEQAGIPGDQVMGILTPLLRSTVENVPTLGLPQALTGPVRRGDVETVARQAALLRRRAPDLWRLYLAGTRAAVAASPDLTEATRQALLDIAGGDPDPDHP